MSVGASAAVATWYREVEKMMKLVRSKTTTSTGLLPSAFAASEAGEAADNHDTRNVSVVRSCHMPSRFPPGLLPVLCFVLFPEDVFTLYLFHKCWNQDQLHLFMGNKTTFILRMSNVMPT